MGRNLKKKFPRIFADWHPVLNGKINPNSVSFTTRKKFWWRCSNKKCGHNWKDTIYSRVKLGRLCPKCVERAKNKTANEIVKIQNAIEKFETLQQQTQKHIEILFKDGVKKWPRRRSFVAVRRNINEISKLGLSMRSIILSCRKKMVQHRKAKK